MTDYLENMNRWLSTDTVDPSTKEEIRALIGNENELKFRFGSNMEFGTAGLRSFMGAGTNMMNIYTVAQATQGLASFILSAIPEGASVAIGYDSRNNSELFAQTAAETLTGNGIKVYIFDDIRPTPELSYAIRELKCNAGIIITASHNPKEYNGYKAYWDDGAQLSPEFAAKVSENIKATDIFTGIKKCDFDTAVAEGKIEFLGRDFDEKYLTRIMEEQKDSSLISKIGDALKIVYTPLHGTGRILVPEVLKRIGLKGLVTVEEQMTADGNFPTVKSPNPENAQAFEIGIQYADKVGSDLIIATDPDADRVGVMARSADGTFKGITGNQMGALLLDYIITAYKEKGGVPDNVYAVKTIVTSEIVSKICESNQVQLHNVLTGFKFIGEVMTRHMEERTGTYLLGFEESYGYLIGTYARDKDAVSAAMLICEMAAYYKLRGMTLCDAMDTLYARYGHYNETVYNLTMSGFDGAEKMAALMKSLRSNPPKTLGGSEIIEVRDYLSAEILNLKTGEKSETGLPISNVLYFVTDTGDVTVIRPSGTEPKVKFYFLMHGDTAEEASEKGQQYLSEMKAMIE